MKPPGTEQLYHNSSSHCLKLYQRNICCKLYQIRLLKRQQNLIWINLKKNTWFWIKYPINGVICLISVLYLGHVLIMSRISLTRIVIPDTLRDSCKLWLHLFQETLYHIIRRFLCRDYHVNISLVGRLQNTNVVSLCPLSSCCSQNNYSIGVTLRYRQIPNISGYIPGIHIFHHTLTFHSVSLVTVVVRL